MKNNTDEQEITLFKEMIYWIIGLSMLLSTISFFTYRAQQATRIIEGAVQNYEEYQEIYNTCNKLNTDICNMKDLSDNDKMFEQFSKAQRILAIRTNLNRWIEDYNAKSKMWGRSLWKSSSLPYQLTNSQFSCNN